MTTSPSDEPREGAASGPAQPEGAQPEGPIDAARDDAARVSASSRDDAAGLEAEPGDARGHGARDGDSLDRAQRAPRTSRPSVERADVEVRARMVPRYGRFMALGALVGLAAGFAWSQTGADGPWLGAGPVVDTSVVVPFLMTISAVAGLVVGAVVALVLERVVGRRRRTLTAERTRHHRVDDADDLD